MIKGWKVLVLNADATPLRVSSWEEIIHLPLEGLASVQEWALDSSGERVPLHAGGFRVVIDLPSVIQVKTFVRKRTQVSFSRHAIYYRDEWKCVYCGDELDIDNITIDHVKSRSSMPGGDCSTWGNCASCCKDCNARKGCLSLADLRTRGIRTHNGKEFRLLQPLGRPPSSMSYSNFIRFVNRKTLCWLSYIPDWERLCKPIGKGWLIEAYDEWCAKSIL